MGPASLLVNARHSKSNVPHLQLSHGVNIVTVNLRAPTQDPLEPLSTIVFLNPCLTLWNLDRPIRC